MSFYLKLLLIFLTLFSNVYAQEICDNGIDDDLDGLIDGFDSIDCPCGKIPIELPNSSFEDFSCCPNSFSKMRCVDEWRAASNTTSDYFNLCGYKTAAFCYPTPPVPDGNGYVGYIDGFFLDGNSYPNYKEYVGTCLLDTLRAGIDYELSFWIVNGRGDFSTTLSIYGSDDSLNQPFGDGSQNFGCPLNDTNWYLLGESKLLVSRSSWQRKTIKFTPSQDAISLVIGPNCKLATQNNYYYLDGLELYEVNTCRSQLQMPNVFTPNSDGVNDLFKPVLMSNVLKSKITIYNRWGQQLFESENLEKGWDGKASGKSVTDGTYFWIISYTDINNEELIQKGNVTIFK